MILYGAKKCSLFMHCSLQLALFQNQHLRTTPYLQASYSDSLLKQCIPTIIGNSVRGHRQLLKAMSSNVSRLIQWRIFAVSAPSKWIFTQTDPWVRLLILLRAIATLQHLNDTRSTICRTTFDNSNTAEATNFNRVPVEAVSKGFSNE